MQYKHIINNIIPADDLHWDEDEKRYASLSGDETQEIISKCIEAGMTDLGDVYKFVQWCGYVRVGQILMKNFLSGSLSSRLLMNLSYSGSAMFSCGMTASCGPGAMALIAAFRRATTAAGMPAGPVSRLSAELQKGLRDAEIVAKLDAIDIEAVGGLPQEFAAFLKNYDANIAAVVKAAKLEAQQEKIRKDEMKAKADGTLSPAERMKLTKAKKAEGGFHWVPLATQAVSEEVKEQIIGKVRQQHPGKQIELKAEVKESIIGGFLLEMGGSLVDASIAYDLNKIKSQFTNNDFIYRIR